MSCYYFTDWTMSCGRIVCVYLSILVLSFCEICLLYTSHVGQRGTGALPAQRLHNVNLLRQKVQTQRPTKQRVTLEPVSYTHLLN